MRGARKISWGSVVQFDWTTEDLVVTVWAPSTYLLRSFKRRRMNTNKIVWGVDLV